MPTFLRTRPWARSAGSRKAAALVLALTVLTLTGVAVGLAVDANEPAESTALAVLRPRDIVFVVNLSGEMNDATEPHWASDALDSKFAAQGNPTIGSDLMEAVYEDFNFDYYPGVLDYIGSPLGVVADDEAFAQLTNNEGPLSGQGVAAQYRIEPQDSQAVRKRKAYSWMMDQHIPSIMPAALPQPDGTDEQSYAYWAQYLDYIVSPQDSSSASQFSRRIDMFNNPNKLIFPKVRDNIARGYRNKIGYQTYVAFMMDHGRNLQPAAGQHVPLSLKSPHCPLHRERVGEGEFKFPPREQPAHATRRALIAMLQVLEKLNGENAEVSQRDRVSVIGCDEADAVYQGLTGDYQAAMRACTRLQASGDEQSTGAVETGLKAACGQLNSGRPSAEKMLVLLTCTEMKVQAGGQVHTIEISGNPASLEQRLTAALQEILTARSGRLVE